MIFVDSNVLIDVFNKDAIWSAWSRATIDRLSDAGEELVVNLIIVAEIASNFDSMEELNGMLDRLDIEIVPIDEGVAYQAGRAFRAYRRQYRERDAILADFLIGAHAQSLAAALVTRDVRLYRNYLPELPLITPETHPDG